MPIPEGKAAVDIADIDLSASAGQGSTPAALASPAAMPCHDNADSATLPPTSSIPADSSGSCLNCEFSCGFVSLHPAIADSGFDMPPPLAISAPEPDALTLAGSRDRALRPPILPRTR
ncbi:MAG: hypothetical protein V2I82_06590 [Halieaceae bacterium]|nr:hypothetical protein [Halieaceae bacterium]